MKWSLQSIGVPLVYRTMNPFALSEAERLDAYPKLANPDCVNSWMEIAGDQRSFPHVAWNHLVHAFVVACEARGERPFILDSERRNDDEQARTFLSVRRKRVRDYIEPLGLVTLPIFRSSHYYTRNEHSWWLRSQARIIKRIDGHAIGKDLQQSHHWIRTHCPEYRGSQSWHRWLQHGVLRVGWSTAVTECWFWYEIRCPHQLGVAGDYRNLDDNAFAKHADGIWLPLVRNLRWWSTSNPRTWEL